MSMALQQAMAVRGMPNAQFRNSKLRFPVAQAPGVGGPSVVGEAGVGVGASMPASASARMQSVVLPDGTVVDPTALQNTVAVQEAVPTVDSEFDPTMLGVGAGAAGAGYALYRMLRNRGAGSAEEFGAADIGNSTKRLSGSSNAPRLGADSRTKFTTRPSDIVDAEYTVVEDPKRLAGPQKRIGTQTSVEDEMKRRKQRERSSEYERDTARAKQQEAARNADIAREERWTRSKQRSAQYSAEVNPAPVAAKPPAEPLDAGVMRTLGKSEADTQLLKLLRENPGLLRTLQRIGR